MVFLPFRQNPIVFTTTTAFRRIIIRKITSAFVSGRPERTPLVTRTTWHNLFVSNAVRARNETTMRLLYDNAPVRCITAGAGYGRNCYLPAHRLGHNCFKMFSKIFSNVVFGSAFGLQRIFEVFSTSTRAR